MSNSIAIIGSQQVVVAEAAVQSVVLETTAQVALLNTSVNAVEITVPSQVIVADTVTTTLEVMVPSAPAVVEVATDGAQWPPGYVPSHNHVQASAAVTWTINHNLGFKPSVELFNTGNHEIEADVLHTSNNQTVVSFTKPMAGYARLT